MTETATADAASDTLASVLADAPFVRLVASDDGDALAAAGLLAGALRTRHTPFQVRVSRDPLPVDGDDQTDGTDQINGDDQTDGTDQTDGNEGVTRDDEVTIPIGTTTGTHAVPGREQPASVTAYATAMALGADPNPVLALAGVVAAGSIPGADGSADALAAAETADQIERRPGVALPTTDLGADLAASTLVRTPYSGDPDVTRAVLDDLGLPTGSGASDSEAPDSSSNGDPITEPDHRRLASMVAIDVAAAPKASDRAATAVERALRPYATTDTAAPFATIGGAADVLDVLARERPGTGIALALAETASPALRSAAIDVWREHGHAAHGAVEAATIARHDGCVVARVDARPAVLPTVARLICDFQSPEPVAMVVNEDDGRIAASTRTPLGASLDDDSSPGTADSATAYPAIGVDLGAACRAAAVEFGGDGWGRPTRGGMDVREADVTAALAALREAL